MSESTDKPVPDEQLDEYLKGDSSVSRHYRQLHSPDVPAELDRLVLRQAEEAVKSRPSRSRTWLRWSGPLAIAASAVLVLSIVIETGVQKEAMVTTAPASAPAPQAKRIEQSENDAAPNAASEEFLANGAEQKSAGTGADKALLNELSRERRGPTPPVTFVPEAPPARIESAPAAPKLDMPAPAIAPQEEPQVETAQAVAQSLPPPPVTPAEPSTVIVSARSKAETAAASSAGAADSASVEEVVLTGNRIQRNQNRLSGPRNTVAVPSASGDARDARAEEPEQREYSDPEAWLKDIRQLRKENKQEAADREWRRFRTTFPDHVVAETDIAREVKK